MKSCPSCGVRNLDSDTYCFNCDEPLVVASAGAPVPGLAGPQTAVPEVPGTKEREIRREASGRATGFPTLFASNMLLKIVLLLAALSIFFLVSIISIWVAYDNLALALAAFGLGGLGFMIALLYPDVRSGLRAGSRGWLVALVADIIFLGVTVFPVLYYLAGKGYIAGEFDWLGRYYWALAPAPLLGAVAASVAGLFCRQDR